jgi:hypothetical protein
MSLKQTGRCSLRFRHDILRANPELHRVIAEFDGEQIGVLTWGLHTHEVHWISVHQEHQRHGVASGMWFWAMEIDPLIRHSQRLSPDGRKWKVRLEAR